MSLLNMLKTSTSLLLRGNWREFYLRSLIALGRIDLKTITIDELALSPECSHSYSDSGREDLQRVLAALNIKRGDAIVDFGCGKGGALITLAEYDFSKITGVEISAELSEIARKNLDRLKLKDVEVICCDARKYLELDDYNYAYFFNPFPCAVMADVLENISISLKKSPRKITLIYLNPECHEAILESGIFQKVNEYKHSSHVFYVYSN
jgi:SAM-dependent methyltransferase